MADQEEGKSVIPGSGARGTAGTPMKLVVASILSVMAWAIFILIYALFWSTSFNIFQNIIVTIVSLFIAGLAIGLIWVVWGPKENWEKH